MTWAHRPKAAYEQVRKLYSPVRALTIQGDTVSVEPRHVDEIPSYALRGYQLRWTVRDAAGAVLKEGVLALPDLRARRSRLDGPGPRGRG